MNDSYTTIRVSGTGEYIEKKSKFIGEVHFAKTLPEAEAFLRVFDSLKMNKGPETASWRYFFVKLYRF